MQPYFNKNLFKKKWNQNDEQHQYHPMINAIEESTKEIRNNLNLFHVSESYFSFRESFVFFPISKFLATVLLLRGSSSLLASKLA